MEKRKKFIVRVNLDDIMKDEMIGSLFMEYLNIYTEEKKVKIEVHFWTTDDSSLKEYDKFKTKHKEVLSKIKAKTFEHIPSQFCWFNIRKGGTLSEQTNFKFASTYFNEDELVKAIFDFFSFVKAATNKGDEKNDSGVSRRQFIRKQNGHKKSTVEPKK